MRAVLLLATLLPLAAGYTQKQWSEFTGRVEHLVNNATKGDQLAVSLGWKDAQKEYSYAAGMVNETDGTRRPVNTNDTYLYGSGSKTLTATAILRLVEKGVVSLDDPVQKHVDRLLGLYANTSLVALWGPRAAQVTVRMCLHMSSGIIDYDNYQFDDWTLINDSMGVVSPVLFISYPEKVAHLPDSEKFVCDPGTCVEYSSTNYVLLGLVLTEHSGQDDWTKLKTSQFWSPEIRARFEDDLHFFTDEPFQKWLTAYGLTATYKPPRYVPNPVVLAKQNSSITGFTCANSVTNPLTMARFQYALLHEGSVLKASTLKEMETVEVLNQGWANGTFAYGLGLIQGSMNFGGGSLNFTGWGDFKGHGGVVFGYTSQQGYYWGVNATLSVVFNTDFGLDHRQDSSSLSCQVVEAAANILYSAGIDMKCTSYF